VTSRDLTLLVWGLLALGVVSAAVLSFLRPRRLPTARAALETLVASPPRRVLVLLAWMWLGWHLFAR
jgi:hypothetical protein